MYYAIAVFILTIVIFPLNAFAGGGGGPLLIIFSWPIYIVGQLWIIALEWLIHRTLLAPDKNKFLLQDVISINLLSTIVIILGGSLLIVLMGLIGEILPNSIGETILALGSWVYDTQSVFPSKLSLISTFCWLGVFFLLIVFYEAYLISKKWKKRQEHYNITPLKLSIIANSVSFIVQILLILIIWREIIF